MTHDCHLCTQQNIGLRRVLLGWNGFHLDGCKVLMRALQHNVTLSELDLTANRVDMHALEYILKGLRKNEHLNVLKVRLRVVLWYYRSLTMRTGGIIAHTNERKPTPNLSGNYCWFSFNTYFSNTIYMQILCLAKYIISYFARVAHISIT